MVKDNKQKLKKKLILMEGKNRINLDLLKKKLKMKLIDLN